MQLIHDFLMFTTDDVFNMPYGIVDTFIYELLISLTGSCKHEVYDLLFTTRMTNTNSQTHEVLAKMAGDIPQAIMSTMTTASLEPNRTRLQVQLIMSYEDLFQRNFIEITDLPDGLATAIHKGSRLDQPDIGTSDPELADLTRELVLGSELAIETTCQLIHKPKPGIMPGLFVIRAWITQAHD